MGMRIRTRTWTCLGSSRILPALLSLFFVPSSTLGQTWKWTTAMVDTFGVQTSIAVDQNQNLHISYFAGAVKYGFRPADSSHWFKMDIAPPAGYEELFTGLTLDSDGNPHVSSASAA
jgi:hypothetical protein